MGTMVLASPFPRLYRYPQHVAVGSFQNLVKADSPLLLVNYYVATKCMLSSSSKANARLLLEPISAVSSGLETSITDPKDNVIVIKNVDIVVESKDDDKMQVRVDLPGKETQIVFDKILRNLARTAPPVPGFRREKGGKTSKLPKEFLLPLLGEDRVNKFVVQEIVSSTLSDYVKKENITVKDNKVTTIQTAEELNSSFIPGTQFRFNATLELPKSTKESS